MASARVSVISQHVSAVILGGDSSVAQWIERNNYNHQRDRRNRSLTSSASAYEQFDTHKYESEIVITTERVGTITGFGRITMVIWHKVTNNSSTDFDDVTFMCDLFKRDGSFFIATEGSALNVKHGHSEYSEQDVEDLDPSEFGRSECRLVGLSDN
jgi:hypothetical protein